MKLLNGSNIIIVFLCFLALSNCNRSNTDLSTPVQFENKIKIFSIPDFIQSPSTEKKVLTLVNGSNSVMKIYSVQGKENSFYVSEKSDITLVALKNSFTLDLSSKIVTLNEDEIIFLPKRTYFRFYSKNNKPAKVLFTLHSNDINDMNIVTEDFLNQIK